MDCGSIVLPKGPSAFGRFPEAATDSTPLSFCLPSTRMSVPRKVAGTIAKINLHVFLGHLLNCVGVPHNSFDIRSDWHVTVLEKGH